MDQNFQSYALIVNNSPFYVLCLDIYILIVNNSPFRFLLNQCLREFLAGGISKRLGRKEARASKSLYLILKKMVESLN